ncbi:MAG TPA: LPS-assembly protein LptD [Gammaproteobacteria bacterium]|nr:LPS-assembly protein LptD [Gammaproteobacteria bacterium]
MTHTCRSLTGIVLFLLTIPLNAEPLKPAAVFCQPVTAVPDITPEDDLVHIGADEVQTLDNDTLLFNGSVSLQQGKQLIKAERLKVFKEPRRIEAEGGIEIRSESVIIRGQSAEIDEQKKVGRFKQVDYEYLPRHAYGGARSITQKGKRLTLKDATYSTCNRGNEDWIIRAKKIRLDRGLGLGLAQQASLRFKGVPLLYIPAITFPIDDQRRSGLLYPIIGNTQGTGTEISLPFYWNIAPQYDATITPRYMSQRGTMLVNNFRYLMGENGKGEIGADYLDNDDRTDTHRYRYRLKHRSKPGRHWLIELQAEKVSDSDYFTDFSSGLAATSITHLERRADLRYSARHLRGLIRTQAYQTIDDTLSVDDRPYRRLPQITLEGTAPFLQGNLNLSLETDFTRFSHQSRVDGVRLELAPRLSYSWLRPGAFFKPETILRHTRYDLENNQPGQPAAFRRTVPVSTLDSGLIFERETRNGHTQTLEPRLYYLYAPFRDQNEIPVFDTYEPAFIFSSLFRENRFSGLDRVGDANQLTMALSTRLIKQATGSEQARASLGQIYYFNDRKVVLPDNPVETSNRSNFAAELSVSPNKNWSLRGSLIADETFRKAKVVTARLHYQNDHHRIFNLEHRFHAEDDIEQTDLSLVWPIGQKWHFLSRWLYSHQSNRDIEVLLGVGYESCCWEARFSSRRYILDDEGEYNNSLYFQLILKGLASFGRSAKLLEKSIPGYAINED